MKPRRRSEGAAVLAACALLLTLTGAVQAQTLSDPAAVVRELFVHYGAGDLTGASRLWIDGAPEEGFRRRHRARLEKRCIRIESLTIEAVSTDPPVFDVAAKLSLRARTFGALEWQESSRSRISLQRDGEAWKITEWEPRERELVDRLLATDASGRAALLASSVDLQTTTFVRLASQRGIDLVNQGRLESAAMITSAARDVAEELGDPPAMAAALSAASVVLRAQNDLPHSLALAEEALPLAERGGDPDVLASALTRLARVHVRLKGIADPELPERALAAVHDLEDLAIAAHATVLLGQAYEGRRRLREAFRLAQLASRYAEASGDRAAQVSAAMFLRGAFLWIGEFQIADRHGLRAAELAAQGDYDGPAAFILAGLANSLASNGEYPDALRMLEDALRKARTPAAVSYLLHSRAMVHASMNRFDEADRDLDRVLELQPLDPSLAQEFAMARANVAMARGDDEAALGYLHAAHGPELPVDRFARHLEAEILTRRSRFDEARAIVDELGTLTDGMQLNDPQWSLFLTAWHLNYRLLVELQLAQGDAGAALQTGEQMKAAYLAEMLAGGSKAAPTRSEPHPGEQALEERIHDLNRRLAANNVSGPAAAALRKQLQATRIDLLDLRQRLWAEGPSRPEPRPADLCVEHLPDDLDDVTIVSYIIGSNRTFVFVLQPKRQGRRDLIVRSIEIDRNDLRDRVVALSMLIEQRNLRAPAAAAEIYDLLIQPIETFVREARALAIIPDATLWRVPFQALGPAGGPLLVDRLPVFYAPSFSVLAAARPRRTESGPRKPRLLAFANPSVGTQTAALYRAFDPDAPLGVIPEAEEEVRAIGRIYGREASRIYVGKTARETTLKQEAGADYDVLHIATHGIVYESAPMFSALLLSASPDESDDGVLEAREIAALALEADLTVLSACETGRATVSGTGVIGLSWAFLAAGCPTTVVSQWKAHSAASAALMVEFHRQLARGRSRPEALRRAQLALRTDRRYRHPFYWAPFMVIGRP